MRLFTCTEYATQAAGRGHTQILSNYINLGGHFTKRDDTYEMTPIQIAMHNGHVDSTGMLLLKKGAVYFNENRTIQLVLDCLKIKIPATQKIDGFLLLASHNGKPVFITSNETLEAALKNKQFTFPNKKGIPKQFAEERAYQLKEASILSRCTSKR